ncbi:MAG: sensor histidine kinase [Peptostreptococcaceae bacterium]
MSFIFLLLIIFVLKMLAEKSHIQSASNIIEHQLSIQLNHYNKLEDYIRKSRMIVHDTKHHILALDILLKNNNFEDAKSYIEHLEDDLFILERNKVCDNKIIDAVIQYAILDCSNKNIDLNYNIKISENISVDNVDLAVIFGNLLNNAVESCLAIEDKSIKKHISISGGIINRNIVVKIINSNTKKIRYNSIGLLKTSKLNKQNHGIGLISVKNSIDKYNGSIRFNPTPNNFEIIFMIPLK